MPSPPFRSRTPARPRFVSYALLTLIALLMTGLLAAPPLAVSAAVSPTVLGTAQGFLVLGGAAVTNTGTTTVTGGSLGVSPGTAISGFPPGIVVPPGAIHAADAVAAQAQSDVTTAYNVLAGQARTATLTGQDLGGKTLIPGVYFFATAAQLTGPLTLDAKGDASAVFVFQIGSTLTTASNASVLLINGASPCNVYWQVGSSATLGTGTRFVGNILALTSITLNTGTSVSGRALARNGATTLDTNTFSSGGCAASASPTAIPATATVVSATATRASSTPISPTGTAVIPATGTPVLPTETPATAIPATGAPVVSTGTPATAIPDTGMPVISTETLATPIPATGTPVVPTAIPAMQPQTNAIPAKARPNAPQSALATPIIIGPVMSGPNRGAPGYTGFPTDTSAPSGSVATAAIPAPSTVIPATATVISRTLALVGSSASTADTTGSVAAPASSTATAPPIPVSLPNTGGGGMATHFTATAAPVNDHGTPGVFWMVITALLALTGAGLLRVRQARR